MTSFWDLDVAAARPALAAVLVATLCISLGGCGLSRPATVKQTYLLQTPPAVTATGVTARPSTLKVGSIAVAAPFRGKSLVYRESELKYESDFYNEFFVTPAAMFTESASAWLATSGIFKDVLPASANADGDFVLEGFVSELYGDYRVAGKPVAVLTARFFVLDNSVFTGVPVWQTELKQRVPLANTNSETLAAGLNAAWGAMLTDLSRELAAAKLSR
jgi:cholesterol transport system auxiliary component